MGRLTRRLQGGKGGGEGGGRKEVYLSSINLLSKCGCGLHGTSLTLNQPQTHKCVH